MTTQVIISSPEHNHQDIEIDVVGGDGTARATHRLTDGETVCLYVFDNQQLRISEVAKIAKVAP